MHKIIDKLTEELYEYEKKADDLSAGDVEMIYKLASSVKNLHKIKGMEDGGYSEATDFMGEGRMYGTSYDGGMSYARGRRYAKRDSMGRYSRDGGYSSAYDRGSSYDGRGGYTHDGYSRGGDSKEHMLGKLESMMHEADSEQDRKAIRTCIQKIENA